MTKLERLQRLATVIQGALRSGPFRTFPTAKFFSEVIRESSELAILSSLESFSASPEVVFRWIAGEDIPPPQTTRQICEEISDIAAQRAKNMDGNTRTRVFLSRPPDPIMHEPYVARKINKRMCDEEGKVIIHSYVNDFNYPHYFYWKNGESHRMRDFDEARDMVESGRARWVRDGDYYEKP